MSAQIRATRRAALALLLIAVSCTVARAGRAYPTPAASVIDELRSHLRPTDMLRVTTDSARFVTRIRVLNEYGLLGMSVGDRSRARPDQMPWANIARIDVETNHRTLLQFMVSAIVAGVVFGQGAASTSTPLAIGALGGSLLAGAIGSRIVHDRPLYIAPAP